MTINFHNNLIWFKTNDSVSVKLSLLDDEETRKMWDFKFELVYEIVLSKDSLVNNLTVKNLGRLKRILFFLKVFFKHSFFFLASDEFDFTSLLHTYFKIDDINKVKIENLNGLTFVDKVFFSIFLIILI